MGGGTTITRLETTGKDGLSPRGRGNRCRYKRSYRLSGVYPRVGGGTTLHAEGNYPNLGLSPRGRGNPYRRWAYTARSGSIPAWAGEPYKTDGDAQGTEVYPRVGGGTKDDLTTDTGYDGLSRVGGGTETVCGSQRPLLGLSPRGRGNHNPSLPRRIGPRSIPAWAGEPNS